MSAGQFPLWPVPANFIPVTQQLETAAARLSRVPTWLATSMQVAGWVTLCVMSLGLGVSWHALVHQPTLAVIIVIPVSTIGVMLIVSGTFSKFTAKQIEASAERAQILANQAHLASQNEQLVGMVSELLALVQSLGGGVAGAGLRRRLEGLEARVNGLPKYDTGQFRILTQRIATEAKREGYAEGYADAVDTEPDGSANGKLRFLPNRHGKGETHS